MFFKKKFDLAGYDEDMKESYIILKLLDRNQVMNFGRKSAKFASNIGKADSSKVDKDLKAIEESNELFNFLFSSVKDCFIDGVIFDNDLKKERPMKKDDLDSFPPNIIADMTQFVQGTFIKKN